MATEFERSVMPIILMIERSSDGLKFFMYAKA
jgi:hypothetical protein